MATDKSDSDSSNNDYQLLGEDYPTYDFSFKVIVIGDSGKKL